MCCNAGDFPLCSFCGECYEGWQQVLNQASAQLQQSIEQINTMSAPYGMSAAYAVLGI